MSYASRVRPCPGEAVSGDAVFVSQRGQGLLACIVDVLGHGPEASDLAQRIEAFLETQDGSDVAELMSRMHEEFRGSRGAAVGLCWLAPESATLIYTGTGNTALRRFSRTSDERLVSQDGVVGQNMRTPRPADLSLDAGDLIVLYTDGIQDRFSADLYPGITYQAPREVAHRLIERFGKDHDDAACIVMRLPS